MTLNPDTQQPDDVQAIREALDRFVPPRYRAIPVLAALDRIEAALAEARRAIRAHLGDADAHGGLPCLAAVEHLRISLASLPGEPRALNEPDGPNPAKAATVGDSGSLSAPRGGGDSTQ